MQKIIFIIITYFLLLIPVKAKENNLVNIYLFHSNTCDHCKEEIKFLELLEKKYTNVSIYKYEISDSNNEEIINKIEEIYNIKLNGVPLTIIGDKYYKGYSEEKTPSKIIATVNYYSIYGYQDKLGESIKNIKLPPKEISNNPISVDEYIKQNSSYNVVFNLESDDIDINTASSLLGIRASLNILNLLLIIGIVILVEKSKDKKEKIIICGIYAIATIGFEILNYLINTNLIIIIIYILISTIILLSTLKKIEHIIKYILIIGITGLILITKNIIGTNEINILKNILELNLTTIFKTIINVIIYIFSYMSVNTIIILLINKLILKLRNKLVVQK